MKVLLTNDDGVHAPGINILYHTLKKNHEVTVVAPLEERSTTGHTLTLDSPLRVVEIEKNIYGCSGYPADCSLLALAHLLKDNRPDIVISGINRGANLGQDCFYSGTVAAAREASFRNVPAIAVSSVVDFLKNPPQSSDDECYQTAADFISALLDLECHKMINSRTLINVNVPNLKVREIKAVEVTRPGFRYYSEQVLKRKDFRNRDYYWIGGIYNGFEQLEGSDCKSVDDGKISLTPMMLDHQGAFPTDDEIKRWKEFVQALDKWNICYQEGEL